MLPGVNILGRWFSNTEHLLSFAEYNVMSPKA